MADERIDIAVVGGGISGIYSAWRLQQAAPHRKVVVLEGSDHIGGRLLSVRPPHLPNMVAELGGMRILPAVQPRITRLLETLNAVLPKDQQITTYEFPVDEPQNIAYLRGVYLRLEDFTQKPLKIPYHLTFLEQGSTANSILLNAIEQLVPGITNPALTEAQRRTMAQQASFADVPLYQQGFWNVLSRVISNEAYHLGVDAGGYQSTLSNWNAADAIPWYLSDFGVRPHYRAFTRGFQSVPQALAMLFRQAGGDIRLRAQVEGFQAVDGGFALQVQGQTLRTASLILAMPRRALDLLMPTSPLLQDIQDLIASVTPQPLFKLFTTYSSPWWRAAGYSSPNGTFVPVEAGRTVTDLPVRQTYYWPQDNGQPVTTGPAMLLASYDDGNSSGFWDGLRPQRRQAWPAGREVADLAEPFLGMPDPQADPCWQRYQAPSRMVHEVARQLAIIHGLTYTPHVQNAAFRDWGDDPFGGGWNSWNIGVKSWEVKEQIVKPLPAHDLYICGEAYSDAQGWVEGALQTADMLLHKYGLGAL